MSWYYIYSLGVQDAKGKIYPILFTPQNERLDIVNNSRSFEPEELDSVFYPLHEENVTIISLIVLLTNFLLEVISKRRMY